MTETPDEELRRLRAEATNSITKSLENLSRTVAEQYTAIQDDIGEIKLSQARTEEKMKLEDCGPRLAKLENVLAGAEGALKPIRIALGALWAIVAALIVAWFANHKW